MARISCGLQWGRTLSSAESPPRYLRSLRLKISFNGAALFQVRKEPQQLDKSSPSSRFNGAALFQVRKAWQLQHFPGVSGRFNGAALFQVRKGKESRFPQRFPLPASMGPHSFKCGKYSWPIILASRIKCFNGAALFQVRKEKEVQQAGK